MTRRLAAALLLGFWAALAAAQLPVVPKPGAKDLCPVCGMLVAKYPHWIATIVYQDGHAHFFDGAKDMLKFWNDPPRYAAAHSRAMMRRLTVTDYYSLQAIDAQAAYYVVGSDVLGPMGHEFVPLATQAAAEDFLKEHKGKRILRFDQIGREMPARLDAGKF